MKPNLSLYNKQKSDQWRQDMRYSLKQQSRSRSSVWKFTGSFRLSKISFSYNRSRLQVLTMLSFPSHEGFVKQTQRSSGNTECCAAKRETTQTFTRFGGEFPAWTSRQTHGFRWIHTECRQTWYSLYINIALVCLREIQLAAGENERTNIISILDQTDIFPQKHSEHLFVMYLSLNSEKHIFEICTDGHHRRIPHC